MYPLIHITSLFNYFIVRVLCNDFMIHVYCVLLVFPSPKLYLATFPIIVLISFHPNISLLYYVSVSFFPCVESRREGAHRSDVRCRFQKFLASSLGLSNSQILGFDEPSSQNGRWAPGTQLLQHLKSKHHRLLLGIKWRPSSLIGKHLTLWAFTQSISLF